MSKYSVTYGLDFKRQDTTYIMSVQLYDDGDQPLTPNTSHNWSAKVVRGEKGVGKTYAVSLDGNNINIPAKQFSDLPSGAYGLELWEANNGNTTIYPSAGFIPFRIHRNADDSLQEIDPTIDINQIIKDLHQAGLNIVFDSVEMLDGNANPQITSRVYNGQNHVSLKIPRGKQGDPGITPHVDSTTGNWFVGNTDTKVHAQGKTGSTGEPGVTWQPYINKSDGHWHLKKVSGQFGLTDGDLQQLKNYIDDKILNGKW